MTLYWVALNSIHGLGPVKIGKLIEFFKTPEAIFKESRENLRRSGLLSDTSCNAIHDPVTLSKAEALIEKTSRLNISILTLFDSDYPEYLKQIFAPPPILFVKGDRSHFKKYAVSIVGTRTPTQYGRAATLQIVKGLVRNNLVVVSGLARGIDTIAHENTLALDGVTIAVLGCGIDVIYPKSNLDLAERIAERGVLVSEFNPGTPPEAYNFPRRNRIISGLSAAVVVVEAGEKSGSLITADYALQQSREIFAVPGPVTSGMSDGTFKLLKDGAMPARSGEEIAESLRMVTMSTIRQSSVQVPQPKEPELIESERTVYSRISDQPIRIDELIEQTGLEFIDLFGILLNLELKGLIEQIRGQQFIKVNKL